MSDQALPRLDMAQARGWAKLLRQAALVTANGSEARSERRWGSTCRSQRGFSVEPPPIVFGTQLEVLPRYDRESGRIELTIHADVSDLA